MPYYLIEYDYGTGAIGEVIEADDQKDAEQQAYEAWREGAEGEASYTAEPITHDNLENHGIDPKDYSLEPVED